MPTPWNLGTYLTPANNLTDLSSPAIALVNLGAMYSLATTGASGFALQNATPTMITWTAPNDGLIHRVILIHMVNVSSNETGGVLTASFTDPANTAGTLAIDPGGRTTGTYPGTFGVFLVKAGTTVSVAQTALTVGAATLYCEFWGS